MTPADLQVAEPAPYETYMGQLERGGLSFQRCLACGEAFFYPRVLCPHCGAVDLQWELAAGEGVIYSSTVVQERDGSTYALCLVDLEEGFRMMSNVVGIPAEQVRIGDRVVGRVEAGSDDRPARVVFEKGGDR